MLFTVFTAQAQYIHHVFEYKPAPGQFINKTPWGHPSSAESIIGGISGSLSLGSFGGYVVFGFEHPVVNHPDNPFGVDFILFGNPLNNFYEPGIVSVMKDENNNGIPDDTWYELAGSDYFFSNTLQDNQVTYFNPHQDVAADVPWSDNLGNQGVVLSKSFHLQPYYPLDSLFPLVDKEQYTLEGTRIMGFIDTSTPGVIISRKRGFGYADNNPTGTEPFNLPDNPYTQQTENAGGDGFDIDWAVDKDGNYIELDQIDFVRVHTAVMDDAGWLGEVSTEIKGAIVVEPNSAIQGVLDLVVIKDLPQPITTTQVQLEAFAFSKGGVQWDREIIWTSDLDGSYIDDNSVLHLTESGEVTLTAAVADEPGIFARVTTLVDLPDLGLTDYHGLESFTVSPNPASHYIELLGVNPGEVLIYNAAGTLVNKTFYSASDRISVNDLPSGLYILHVMMPNRSVVRKFVINR